jgi:endonuclease/exonuclease/phosphatase (EEP) superfamily protein YafD
MPPASTPSAKPSTPGPFARRFGRIVFAGTLAAGAASLAGFSGRAWWPFELASHFRVQYFWSLTAAVLAFAVLRRRRDCLIAAAFAVLNFAVVLPFYLPESQRAEPGGAVHSVRALALNLYAGNNRYDVVCALVRDVRPDVVALSEFTDAWNDGLTELHAEFPYRHLVSRHGNFGMALLSRIPIRASRTDYLSNGDPAIVAEMAGDVPWTVVVAHPFPPVGRQAMAARNLELQRLAEIVRAEPKPVVVLGDLNITPWSPYFHDLLDGTGLHDSRRGFGVQPSWPAGNPLLRIPIDHCLATSDIAILRQEIGPNVGSDHFPLIVEFAVSPGGSR